MTGDTFAGVQFGILGPLVVWRDGREVPIGAAKQRALLALLLLRRGEFVPTETLIDELWGGTPPPTAGKALQVYVSQLRKVLETGMLETRPVGYMLRLEPGALDAVRFEDLLTAARALLAGGDARKSGEVAREALGLWRGPALAEFRYDDFARDEIGRLEGLRLVALELRLEADLALGRHAEGVPELEALVREHPLRESLRELLILALYRAGRQADALAAYQDARTALVDGLGLDPGTSLQQLETAILRHDPTLEVPDRAEHIYRRDNVGRAGSPAAGTASAPVAHTGNEHALEKERRSGPASAWRWTRRRLVMAIAGPLAAAGLIAIVVGMLGSSGTARPLPKVDSNTVGLINPGTNRIVDEVPVGATPSHLAVGEGAIWVTNADGGTVSQIDPANRRVLQTISVGSQPSGIAVGDGAVWVANSLDGTVSRIDPVTQRQVDVIHVGNGPEGIAYGAGAVWVANTDDETIMKFDPKTDRRLKTVDIGGNELVFGAGALWASDTSGGIVARIDPGTGSLTEPIRVGNGPAGVAFGDGSVWVANSLDGTVSRISPATNRVTALIGVGDGPSALAVGAGGVWVSNRFGGTVARIDPGTNQVVRRISVGNRPLGVAISGGNVVVSVRQSGAGHRGGTLRVRMNRAPDSIDPGIASDTASFAILSLTSDGLVAFNQASGLAGTQLVPDLAVSLPSPTDGGRTYAFRLRPNIRYSSGSLVRASDFRFTLERDFKLGQGNTYYYDGIIGADRCEQSPKRCDLSHGIIADNAARTVTFRLVAADPDFLYKIAFEVVPAGTPPRKAGTRPLPATGPYMIASYVPKHVITLRRNPYFHEWSKAAHPDGYPDKIVFQIGGTPDEAVNDVIDGKADVFSTSQSETPPSESRLAAIKLRYASQVHTNPQPTTVALFLNTRVTPFNRLDVRRALNYAASRSAAVRVVGGPNLAQGTCQILPPHFPGYQPYCPYGTAPNLAKARALIAASGTHGMKVTFWSWAPLRGVGPYAVKLLQSLGYRVSIKVFANLNSFTSAFDSRSKAQIGTFEWVADYPTASGFFDAIFSCASFIPNSPSNLNASEFCDRRIDQQIEQGLTAQATNPNAARGLWERIDRQTVDQAPWVPLVNPKVVDVLSKRVGNYQYSPAGLGMLIDQLWVR